MEFNGPWMTDTVTILIETTHGYHTLISLTEYINNRNFFEGTKVDWTMIAVQNPELLFQVADEYDYIPPGTILLLTANTPLWRIHLRGFGVTSTI